MLSDLKRLLSATLALVLVQAALLGAAGSAEADVEVDGDMMRGIEDTAKSLDSNVALKAGKAALADARELAALFVRIEAYYKRKSDAPHAVDLSRKSHQLAAQVVKAVEGQDFDTASDSVNEFIRACKACHDLYKKD
jgi:hypothetical protein